MHPFFYNKHLGFVKEDTIPDFRLEIGHDAWLGANTIVTPRCRRIGHGAVVGAGSVVTSDVPDFAIMAGNPAKLLRYRFSEEVRARVLASRWWELPVEECVKHIASMLKDVEMEYPLLRRKG